MKNQKLVVLAVVVSLFTWIGCSTENLNEETTVAAIEDQDPFITNHQAIFDTIVADDVITDAEFATLSQLEGFTTFNEALMQELEASSSDSLEGVASKRKTRAEIQACLKKQRKKHARNVMVCKTRKKKNRPNCLRKANFVNRGATNICTRDPFQI